MLRFSFQNSPNFSQAFGPSRETSFQTPDTDPFDDTDLETIGEHVKHMNIISHAQGYFYHVKGLLSRKDDPELAHKFYEIAIEKFSDALNSDPNNKEVNLGSSSQDLFFRSY